MYFYEFFQTVFNKDGLFSAAFQSCCNGTLTENPNSLQTLSFEIHSWCIASTMSVVNSLFLVYDCYFSISVALDTVRYREIRIAQ